MRHLLDLSVRLTGDGFLVFVCDAEGLDDGLEILTPAGEYFAQAMSADEHLRELTLHGPAIAGPLAEHDYTLCVRKGDFICLVDNALGRSPSIGVALHAYLRGSQDTRDLASAVAIPGTQSLMLVAGPTDKGYSDLWNASWQRGDRQAATVRLWPND
jgi:hypothetical protein